MRGGEGAVSLVAETHAIHFLAVCVSVCMLPVFPLRLVGQVSAEAGWVLRAWNGR